MYIILYTLDNMKVIEGTGHFHACDNQKWIPYQILYFEIYIPISIIII